MLLLLFCTVPARALGVEGIRFGQQGSNVRMVIDLTDVSDFRTFVMSDPYRLVIDLPAFEWNVSATPGAEQVGITDIRQGQLRKGYSRIVFDLARAMTIKSAVLMPQEQNKNNRIVIEFDPTSSAEFEKKKGAVFGTLTIGEGAGVETAFENLLDQPFLNPKKQNADSLNIPVPPEKPLLPVKNTTSNAEYKPLIIIDPGHGGVDPGALSDNGIYEKDVVLALAKNLRDRLLESGKYRVMMTREKDMFVKLRDRVSFARENKGDLFISLHADSTGKSNVHGSSVYTLSQKASDQQTAKLAEKENQADLMAGIDINVEDEQVAYILGDFLITDTMNQSKFFANTLVKRMKTSGVKILQNPHRFAGFAVLKAPDIPSILIEAGFMSNQAEATRLSQPAHRRKIASAIMNGVDAYFEHAQGLD